MSTQSPVSPSDPLMIAFKKYQETSEYKNTEHWTIKAEDVNHASGVLWAAFDAGCKIKTSGFLGGNTDEKTNVMFTEIWEAARQFYQPKWVRIDGPEDLPKEKGKYLWQSRFQNPHVGYEEIHCLSFTPGDEFDFWNHEKYVAWQVFQPYQPEEKQPDLEND